MVDMICIRSADMSRTSAGLLVGELVACLHGLAGKRGGDALFERGGGNARLGADEHVGDRRSSVGGEVVGADEGDGVGDRRAPVEQPADPEGGTEDGDGVAEVQTEPVCRDLLDDDLAVFGACPALRWRGPPRPVAVS